MDPALRTQIEARVAADLPLLLGLVVVRGSDIICERYYGEMADEPIHLWSVTKSVTNMAVGMAMVEGLLRLEHTLGQLIPERIPAGADPRTASVTVEHLLTVTSGWSCDSSTDFLHLDDAPDWAERTLPGAQWANPLRRYQGDSWRR